MQAVKSIQAGERTQKYEVTYKATRRDSGDKRDLLFQVEAESDWEAIGKANTIVEKQYPGDKFHVLTQNCIVVSEATIDPVYGFLNSLRDCTFHFGEGQRELTIKAPDGGKIGLPFVDEMRGMTANRIERNHRMAALEIKRLLLQSLTQLERHDPGSADAIRKEYRTAINR